MTDETLSRVTQRIIDRSAKTREAFLLSRLDGLTYSEIATRLEVSSSTVKNYLSTALVHCYHSLYGADPLP